MITPPGIIETKLFTRIWDHFGLSVDDLVALQDLCLVQLKSAPVVPGCAGVRKMRLAPVSAAFGKRSSMRLLFKYFENYDLVVMFLVYPKGAKENITADEKKEIVRAAAAIEAEFSKRFKRKNE